MDVPGMEPFDLTGTGLAWREAEVKYHGRNEDMRTYVYPGRLVVEGDWPAARPEECQDDSNRGTWILGDQILVCAGCGLDCT